MLPEIAQADAYAHAFEYAPDMAHLNVLTAYHQHPTHLKVKAGEYTDDTQMSMAVAETLLGDDWSREAFAESFVRCFKRDQRDGYARGFQKFLEQIDDGVEFLAKIRPESNKSGAAMRSVPVGLLAPVAEVIRVSDLQAGITHNTPGGLESARAVALAAHYLLFQIGPKADLGYWLKAMDLPDFAVPWDRTKDGNDGRPTVKGMDCARAAISLVVGHSSMLEVLKEAAGLGGDTDTVAAIACGLASCSDEMLRDFDRRPFLRSKFEKGDFGLPYLADLDVKLFEKFTMEVVDENHVGAAGDADGGDGDAGSGV
jgi:ADP-ribosyl-[dinitrogen reductase] hydrolase